VEQVDKFDKDKLDQTEAYCGTNLFRPIRIDAGPVTLESAYNLVFKKLPVGIVLELSNKKKIFCTHGGIPVDELKQPILLEPNEELPEDTIQQLIWNDPSINSSYTGHNSKRGDIFSLPYAKFYSSTIAEYFLAINDLSCIFRAHEPVKDGFKENFKNVKHYTVFSSANYKQAGRIASIVKINSNHENFRIIKFGEKKYDLSTDNNIPDYEELSTTEDIEI